MRIAVCGLGKLGSPLAVVFASSGIPVIGYDVDEVKIKALRAWQMPIAEPSLDAFLKAPRVRDKLRVTSSAAEAVRDSDACLFVTPTPSLSNGAFNHQYLLNALLQVAAEVRAQDRSGYGFIVNSTVVPGFMSGTAKPSLAQALGGLPFLLAYKPEFIALGTVITDLFNPNVLLIGADDEESGCFLEGLYRLMILNQPCVKRLSLVEAELAKIALNCAVTMKISFANQIGMIAGRLGADPAKVLDAVGADPRVGHAALRSGAPFGGPCFPRDNRMMQYVADGLLLLAPLSKATDIVNAELLAYVLLQVPDTGTVGILGLAYKPHTPITEESAGAWWRERLTSMGRTVKAHDPMAPHPDSLEDVLACETVIIACAWPEYRALKFPESFTHPSGTVIDVAGAMKEQ